MGGNWVAHRISTDLLLWWGFRRRWGWSGVFHTGANRTRRRLGRGLSLPSLLWRCLLLSSSDSYPLLVQGSQILQLPGVGCIWLLYLLSCQVTDGCAINVLLLLWSFVGEWWRGHVLASFLRWFLTSVLLLVSVDLHPGFFAPRLAHVDHILQFLCMCGYQTQIIHIQDSSDPYAVAIMCNGSLWESALEFVYQVRHHYAKYGWA